MIALCIGTDCTCVYTEFNFILSRRS